MSLIFLDYKTLGFIMERENSWVLCALACLLGGPEHFYVYPLTLPLWMLGIKKHIMTPSFLFLVGGMHGDFITLGFNLKHVISNRLCIGMREKDVVLFEHVLDRNFCAFPSDVKHIGREPRFDNERIKNILGVNVNLFKCSCSWSPYYEPRMILEASLYIYLIGARDVYCILNNTPYVPSLVIYKSIN